MTRVHLRYTVFGRPMALVREVTDTRAPYALHWHGVPPTRVTVCLHKRYAVHYNYGDPVVMVRHPALDTCDGDPHPYASCGNPRRCAACTARRADTQILAHRRARCVASHPTRER